MFQQPPPPGQPYPGQPYPAQPFPGQQFPPYPGAPGKRSNPLAVLSALFGVVAVLTEALGVYLLHGVASPPVVLSVAIGLGGVGLVLGFAGLSRTRPMKALGGLGVGLSMATVIHCALFLAYWF